MIRSTLVRIGGIGVVLAAALASVGGCNPASSGSGKGPTVSTTGPDGQPLTPRPPAIDYLGAFVKSLAERKATADSFTAAFKEKIARPKFQNAEHEKLGYDQDSFTRYLDKAAAGGFDGIEAVPAATGTYFASMGKKAGKTENCLIRLAPTEDATGWRVDWLHRTATIAPTYRDASLTPAQIDARIAAIAFLSTMLDGQYDLAEALMTRRYKGELAWSNTPSDAKQGYSSGLLQQLKLSQWKGNAVEFTIAKQDIVEGKPAVITGELVDAGMANRRPYSMTLIKEANGDWLVERFEAK